MRIRTVKPAFWANENMSCLPDFARLLAIGLLNYADDHGFFWANSKMIRGSLFPFEEDHQRIIAGLSQLESVGYVKLGKSTDGRDVGYVVNFKKHQRVDKPQTSEIEPVAVFKDKYKNDLGTIVDESTLYRIGKEGIGKDRIPPAPAATAPEEKKPKERNLLLDALATVGGGKPEEIPPSRWSAVQRCLREIKAVCPDLTVQEIGRRVHNYRNHFRGAALTPEALMKHWPACDGTATCEAPLMR